MTASEKLDAKIAATSTDALLEIAFSINADTTTEAMIVHSRTMRELETRMTESDFLALCDKLDAELDMAA